ncbi:MAG: hypothetical protein A2474_00630 [Elusimicrobia bacterium RIFOXYC2_FULL_34_12]|nr:MAG: hypothetical protein A2474_00630 [Elusimicrobia bacterium RIFOXYC2_FULL_34_12]
MNISKFKRFLPVTILTLLVVVFFYKIIFFNTIFNMADLTGSDILDMGYSFKHFLSQSLMQKTLPVWCSSIGYGFPIHADGEGGFFNPINLILFSILPKLIAFNWSIILSFLIASVFTYLYARNIGLSAVASLVSSISFSFSSFFVGHIRQIHIINIACWLPALILLVKLLIDTNKVIYCILIGIVFGIQILYGYPQIFYYSFIFSLSYFLYKRGQRPLIGFLFLIIIVMVGLSAVQWLPTFELYKLSSYGDLIKWQYKFKDLITFILPYYYGNPVKEVILRNDFIFWEGCIYIGILPLLFALFGILKRFKDNHVKYFVSVCIFMFLLLLIKPVYNIFGYILPGFGFFRFPHRLSLIIIFCLAILSGYGIDYLKKIDLLNRRKYLYLIILFLVVLDLFSFGWKQLRTTDYSAWIKQPESVKFLKKDKDFSRICSFKTDYSYIVANMLDTTYKKEGRLLLAHRELLQSNINLIWDIESSNIYAGLLTKRFFEFEKFISSKYELTPNFPGAKAIVNPEVIKLYGMYNVKYFLSLWTIKSNLLSIESELLFSKNFDKIKIYNNKLLLPKAYLVPKTKIVKDEKSILDIISNKDFNPLNEVVLEKDMDHGYSDINGSNVDIVKYSDNEVIINATLSNEGFLVLNDAYYPGWKAEVNGERKNIFKANYLMRAVALNKGNNTIKFYYDSDYFKIGFVISIITGLIVFVYLIWMFFRESKTSDCIGKEQKES